MSNTSHDGAAAPMKSLELPRVSTGRRIADNIATVLILAAILLALVPLLWVLLTVFINGMSSVVSPGWWINPDLGKNSGVGHAIVGTLLQVAVTSVISIPIGVFVGIYLVEYGRGTKLARLITFMVDILSGVPSIVAALFIYAVWIARFGFDRSGFAVSLALVLLMIPVIVRNTEEMLRIVPQDLREASYALGIPKWKTIVKIVLPTALAGIVTGVLLAISRVVGESAPVLILVGTFPTFNYDLFQGPMSSLPLYMLEQYRQNPNISDALWGAALTLIIIIAVINILSRAISSIFAPKKF